MRTVKAIAAFAPVVLGVILAAPGAAVAAGDEHASTGTRQATAPAFGNFILQTGTALHETDDTFATATTDWDRDGRPDLVAVKKSRTGTNSTEVHILSGASNFQRYILQTGTALHETDASFDFAITDWDRDTRPDLVAVKKNRTGTNSTEVHILSGASNFQRFTLQTGTALHETDASFDFAITDWDRDTRPDLVAV
ncbi:FG-GAP-like repeat-containing protein, partial [Streptomyces netropsis]|uniref:FG-GAP-like repeat-containing protein n=1 Tax=Streptomyces netropsis TaxID=55404 RepID=UPI001C88B817